MKQLTETFAKPIAQIKKFKICLLFVPARPFISIFEVASGEKLINSDAINCISRPETSSGFSLRSNLNQINFNSFFFILKGLQRSLTLILILFSVLFCEPMSLTLSGSYTGKTGNVDYHYFKGAVSVSKIGLIQMGSLSLPDTEFLFSTHRAKSTNNNVPYENDGSMLLKVDLFAHQTFSPFVFINWEFDSLSALDHRANVGLGGKYRFNPYFSISYATLFEQEKYIGEDPGTLYRHSLRPKYKRSFGSPGMSINWQLFYKPRFDNLEKFLLNSILVFSFKTFHDALTIDINYLYDFDSKYSINKVAKSYAYALDGNGEYLTLVEYENLFGPINSDYTTDGNDFVKLPDEFYDPEDHTISVGLTISF